MAKCKYPNEICANMTVLNGVSYCDSVPCSLKDELPKQTNFDRIKAMSVEEFAMFGVTEPWLAWDKDPNDYEDFLDWLNKEVK